MGRRGVSIQDESKWVFNRLAASYPARPPYAPALIDRLTALANGGPIAELGAGMGHLTLPLARRGTQVHAVEPARRMLDLLIAASEGLPIEAHHASAEATGLADASVSLAVLADAAHWVDPELTAVELRRILRPGGIVAVVSAVPGGGAFIDAMKERMKAANPRRSSAPPPTQQLLASVSPGATPVTETFPDAPVIPPDQLRDLLRSMSSLGGVLSEAQLDVLADDARALAAAHGGAVWARTLTLTWVRRR